MSDDPIEGLQAVFLANRKTLLRFLLARGAGDDAEDILQDLWLKISRSATGPVSAPMPYIYRAANMVMIDRYRSSRQAHVRDAEWVAVHSGPTLGVSESPSAERLVAGRQVARLVDEALATLSDRAAEIFRRSRIDGLTQREIAAEFGISVSTVESDLRGAYRVLADLREKLDEE